MVLWLFRVSTAVARRLPRRLLEFLVETLTLRLGFFLHPMRRGIILSNYRRILEKSGQDSSPERAKAVLRETIPLYSRLLISMLARPEDEEFARTRVDMKFLPLLEEALREGNGAILTLSNFGAFAHLLMALWLRGIQTRIPILDRRTVAGLPHGWGRQFTSLDRSSWGCLDALAENKVVVQLTMVSFLPRRMAFELFGAPARLTYAPAKLAAASGAPLIPLFAVREEGRCSAVSDGMIRVARGPGEVRRATEELSRVQERYISRYPAQWHVYEDFWDLRWMDLNYAFVKRALNLFGDR